MALRPEPATERSRCDYCGAHVTADFRRTYGTDDKRTKRCPVRLLDTNPPTGASVSTDTGESKSLGNFTAGETKSVSLNATMSTSQLTFDANRGAFDYEWQLEERAEPVDPAVIVNGNKTSYTGRLADGDTVSLTADPAWIQAGENVVDVQIGGPTTGPTPVVGLDYGHDARDDQMVEYAGETWSERYNVSKTYGSAQQNAQLEIPVAGEVVRIRSLEQRVNGGDWTVVGASAYTLDGTKLTVALGDVQKDDEVEVRAVGSKVRPVNGDIEVLEPTTEGSTLDTAFEITSYSEGFYVDVGGNTSS